MAAYLIVDVDNLLEHFRSLGIQIDLQELAVGLRAGAALAAGLMSKEQLKAVAVADWDGTIPKPRPDPQYVFKAAGYETFAVHDRANIADALALQYFQFDPDPVDELILATTDSQLMPLIRQVKLSRSARIRMWGSRDILGGTEFADQVIFQPLETLLGIQQTKNVALYIDFENISISLAEQGYVVNLDQLIDSFLRQGRAHGNVVKMAAYAPWGTRGSLPPMVDDNGREVTEDAPNRLMQRNIDPVYSLAGKNSADMRIARDIITDSGHTDAGDIYIVASGDRDFKDVINTLRSRNKSVILWSVQGTLSRQLGNNPDLLIEYVENFANLQTHQSLSLAALQTATDDTDTTGFTPSQWSSVILQLDRHIQENEVEALTRKKLIDLLVEVGAVVSRPRGEDLVAQAVSIGILRRMSGRDRLALSLAHPIVEKTLLIRDRIVMRVQNTLAVRSWEYVNYGFLLKGLAMDRELERGGMNYSDQWRSDWIDCLVREQVLVREIVPHRHNPEDVVPVIKLNPDYKLPASKTTAVPATDEEMNWEGITLPELERGEPETADMCRRIIVSVEQFTSFRNFTWCPLGSLHKRLRQYDGNMNFQRGVEYLLENGASQVREYPNPQNEFFTKGISLTVESPIVRTVLAERNGFIQILLSLYERNIAIMDQSLRGQDPGERYDLPLWVSIMETENVLNAVPGRPGQYGLFRTHHTVTLVADGERSQ
ncbi:MAG: NYN domain-containing protein [Chloroflexota bacterium]|nr:NYN domain-containing protein [Chloroflexota bacterium]